MVNYRSYISLICFILYAVLTPFTASCADYCFEKAASMYHISPDLLRAISNHESRHDPLAVNWNANGSYDFGHMQINSSHYQDLGHNLWMTLDDPCQNTIVGAWILAKCIQMYGYNWEAIGCYNSGTGSGRQKQDKRAKYAWKIYRELQKNEKHVSMPVTNRKNSN